SRDVRVRGGVEPLDVRVRAEAGEVDRDRARRRYVGHAGSVGSDGRGGVVARAGGAARREGPEASGEEGVPGVRNERLPRERLQERREVTELTGPGRGRGRREVARGRRGDEVEVAVHERRRAGGRRPPVLPADDERCTELTRTEPLVLVLTFDQ